MPIYSPAPTFADGQYASAGAHLQALGNNCNALLALHQARSVLWTVYACGGPTDWWIGRLADDWRRVWSGAIRHKVDTLSWGVSVTADSVIGVTLRVQYGTTYTTIQAVAGGSGTATYTGTVDLSALVPAPTTDEFYECNVDVRATAAPHDVLGTTSVTLLYIYESDAQSYGSLAAFTAGTTPTGAQWQALSTRADTLYDQAMGPRVPFVGGVGGPDKTLWRGSLEYLHRYLFYDVRIRPPYEDGTTTVTLTVDGNDYTLGSRTTPTDRWPAPHSADEGDTGDEDEGYQFFTHRGTVDLNSLGLTVGTLYTASVAVAHTGDPTIATAKLHLLFQQTPTTPSLAGWTTPPTFVRGTTVGGAGSMKVIRDDLTWLSSRIAYRNPATMRRDIPHTMPQRMVRAHRWLHYRCEPIPKAAGEEPEDLQPSLGYWDGVEWQEVSLPYKPNEWLWHDMSGDARLWEGAVYRLRDITYAIEDQNA